MKNINNTTYSHNKKKHMNSIDTLLHKLKLTIVKNLDSGWNGDSYIVKNNNNELLVLKLERMDEYNKKHKFESEYYRQIEFNKLVAKKHPNNFMVLENYGVMQNCIFTHSKTEEVKLHANEKRKARFIRKKSQPNCYYLLYKPVLDGTFKNVKDEIQNDKELLLDFLIQIIKSINIYRKLGFIHTDVNIGNIMFKKYDNKYQWYWIDYGNITNAKYPDSLLDIERKEEQPDYKTNMMADLINIVQRFCMSSNIANHKITGIQKKKFIEKIQENDSIYNEIISYIPLTNNLIMFNHIFILIFKILYPQEYSNYFNIEYDNKQEIIKKQLLLCIKHSNDKRYDKLINLIK